MNKGNNIRFKTTFKTIIASHYYFRHISNLDLKSDGGLVVIIPLLLLLYILTYICSTYQFELGVQHCLITG